MSVPGKRPYTGLSVENQGAGAKADIHPGETGLILGTQLGYRLLRVWCVETWFWSAVHLDQSDICINPLLSNENHNSRQQPFCENHLVSYIIVHSGAPKWLTESSVLLPSRLSLLVTYTYVNIFLCIFIYMYDRTLCVYKAEYIFPLAMS